jgi:hypothetical protein
MPGGAFTFAVPRGQRFDDTLNVPRHLTLWRGLDPNRAWNAANYNPLAPGNEVHYSALRTEELSTKVSDRISLAVLGLLYPGWKIAEFTVAEVRSVGYIAMRDPTNWLDVVLYSAPTPTGHHQRESSKGWLDWLALSSR